jgi:hypothetical protein
MSLILNVYTHEIDSAFEKGMGNPEILPGGTTWFLLLLFYGIIAASAEEALGTA